jgi:hypothetical protein
VNQANERRRIVRGFAIDNSNAEVWVCEIV